MRHQLPVVGPDLAEKHRRMEESAFALMRGTFYRWVGLWHEVCADLADAPRLLAVGDLHVENFGTWRDCEGRLVWGVNDVDEAAVMPYTLDLTRLAASALLARREDHLAMHAGDICRAILDGYQAQLDSGGRAFVLEEENLALRAAALSADRDPARFWAKMQALKPVKTPAPVRRLLTAHMPDQCVKFRVCHRIAGMGSLGRPRYVALGLWEDALIAREAKRAMPSAYGWALGRVDSAIHGARLLNRAVRSADPTYRFDTAGRRPWLVRRLAPRCSRIELRMLPRSRDEVALLEAMGRETANLHLGSRGAVPAIRRDLKRRNPDWLHDAAKRMAEATIADWRAWTKQA